MKASPGPAGERGQRCHPGGGTTQGTRCQWPPTARHSPDSATLEMSTPCSEAMKPSTEKTTKPAKKLVELLITARM